MNRFVDDYWMGDCCNLPLVVMEAVLLVYKEVVLVTAKMHVHPSGWTIEHDRIVQI
jgi:hypothetical protein